MPGFSSPDWLHAVQLAGTSALQCDAGIIGGSAGAANDTLLYGVYIQANATAATLTIGGPLNSSGSAANMLISGSTTTDYFWMPPSPILNEFAAFTFTPSITALVWVFVRAYVGPT